RLGPKEAYRFAKGEEVIASSGQRAKLSRPLDFLVVTDHSDGMGFFPQLIGGDPGLLATQQGRKWYDEINSGKGAQADIDIITSFGKGQLPKGFPTPGTPAYRSAWRETIKAAEDANEPGRFTAFIGYEWTSNAGGNHLHRNIIWRDDGVKASLVEPFTTFPPLGSPNPRDLWKWMAMCEEKAGAEILALAHNGNLSNGRMFPIIESFNGKRIDREYAENRTRWEPLYEATQIKGDGETHPFLSPNDEFANFERWDKGNLDLTEVKKPEMLEFEYVRSALKNGLKMEDELGVNPYKFGLVGSTDAHTGLAAVEEDNFFGKTSSSEPSAERAMHPFVKTDKAVIMGWETTASGYAAVSGGRKIDTDGRSRTSVGSSVDIANATWTNTIGAGEMISVWKDPDFDPALRAFYYVRVIEIPTPRWTAYDAKYFGIKMPAEVTMTTTERAYTSPIWYTP